MQRHEPDDCQKGRATQASGHLETRKNKSRKPVISGAFHTVAASQPLAAASSSSSSRLTGLWGQSAAAGTLLHLKNTPTPSKQCECSRSVVLLFQGAQGSRSLVPTLQTIRLIIQLPNPGSLKNPNKMCREDRGAFPLGSARGNNHVHSGSLRGLHQSSINLRPLLQHVVLTPKIH